MLFSAPSLPCLGPRFSLSWPSPPFSSLCLLLILSGLFAPSSPASAAPPRPVFAVLIGIQTYKNGLSSLQYTASDVRALKNALTTHGGIPGSQIKTLLNQEATKSAIKFALKTWLPKKLKAYRDTHGDADPTVILFFAGHGEAYDNQAYWLPYDAKKRKAENGEKVLITTSALGSDEVDSWLKNLKTPNVIIFTDACHSGGRTTTGGAASFNSERFGSNFIRISSSKQKQISWESESLGHGIFTYALIQGLKGKALPQGKGVVTVGKLWAYLEEEVEALVKKYKDGQSQQPSLKGQMSGSIPLSFPFSEPPPPPPPTPETTTLRIETTPPGATLSLNGSELGRTPWEGSVQPGRPSILLRLDSYLPHNATLRLRSNQRHSFAYTLLPRPPVEGERRTFDTSGVSFATRYIPSGSFTMGSPKKETALVFADCKRHRSETVCNDWYKNAAQRKVTLSRSFWMFETEVTQGQFHALMKRNPSHFKACGDTCPVESVSWHEAAAFAKALSEAQGLESCFTCTGPGKNVVCQAASPRSYLSCKGWRLPTEAEWEYAARAKTKTATYNQDSPFELKGTNNAPNLDPIAWYGGNSSVSYEGASDCSDWLEPQYKKDKCGPQPVGGKRANAWGLRDMIGNVWEWCYDFYGSYTGLPRKDPVGSSKAGDRVNRGGCWGSNARNSRAAYRYRDAPSVRWSNLGFRLLRSDVR